MTLAPPTSRPASRRHHLRAAALIVVALLLAACHQGFQTAPHDSAATGTGVSTVTGVSFGAHPGFDRMVLAISGPVPEAHLEYVSRVVQDGSGAGVPLIGHAFLSLMMQSTHLGSGVQSQYIPSLTGIRHVKPTGDFEAVSSFGIGVQALRPFRIYSLTGPPRLVVDVEQ